jgi:hypothetical protein
VVGSSVESDATVIPDNPELGGDLNGARVGRTFGENTADETLVVALAVAHRRVQHGHAEFDRMSYRADRFRIVGRAVALGETHAAQANS